MVVEIDKPKLLADAIAIISDIVTEVRIKFLEDGMSIVAVDPANIAMIIFKIPKESFSKYEFGREVLGVNLEDLKRILKRASPSSKIQFEEEDNQLKISISDKVKRDFVLSLIDVESEDKKEISLEFSGKVTMDCGSFSQVVEDCAILADSCAFIVAENSFIIEGKGSLNSARAQFSSDEVSIEGKGRSKYSLEYLMKFIKAGKLSEKVTISFSENSPLRLDFAGEKMGMGFVLAPRFEND